MLKQQIKTKKSNTWISEETFLFKECKTWFHDISLKLIP